VFKKGDLVFLNEQGQTLFHYIEGENGIIMSERYLLFEYDVSPDVTMVEYYGYDVLIKGRLFKEMPEKFLMRVIKIEENTK